MRSTARASSLGSGRRREDDFAVPPRALRSSGVSFLLFAVRSSVARACQEACATLRKPTLISPKRHNRAWWFALSPLQDRTIWVETW